MFCSIIIPSGGYYRVIFCNYLSNLSHAFSLNCEFITIASMVYSQILNWDNHSIADNNTIDMNGDMTTLPTFH